MQVVGLNKPRDKVVYHAHFFQGGGESIVILIFLLFSDQISGGHKSLKGEGQTASGDTSFLPEEESQRVGKVSLDLIWIKEPGIRKFLRYGKLNLLF